MSLFFFSFYRKSGIALAKSRSAACNKWQPVTGNKYAFEAPSLIGVAMSSSLPWTA